jgi:hypothetical protein
VNVAVVITEAVWPLVVASRTVRENAVAMTVVAIPVLTHVTVRARCVTPAVVPAKTPVNRKAVPNLIFNVVGPTTGVTSNKTVAIVSRATVATYMVNVNRFANPKVVPNLEFNAVKQMMDATMKLIVVIVLQEHVNPTGSARLST